MEDFADRINKLEMKVALQEDKYPIQRVVGQIERSKTKGFCFSTRLVTVPDNYYNLSLAERAKILACNQDQLCKAILFEDSNVTSTDSQRTPKYYLVIVQYIAKISSDKLKEFIQKNSNKYSPNKKLSPHLRIADENDSAKLTGFQHNAVSPFGLRSSIPIILAEAITKVKPNFIFLGGGDVNVKLGISVSDFIGSMDALVGDISDKRLMEDQSDY